MQPLTVIEHLDVVEQCHARLGFRGKDAPLHRFQYTFDLAGNRTQQIVTIGAGSPVTTNTTYNAGNQITNSGYTYDANGNLTNDGTSAYTWDRANRLLNVGAAGANVSKYDGLGNRISRNTGGFVVNLLQDLQPGLAQNVAIGYPRLGTTSRQMQTPMPASVFVSVQSMTHRIWLVYNQVDSTTTVDFTHRFCRFCSPLHAVPLLSWFHRLELTGQGVDHTAVRHIFAVLQKNRNLTSRDCKNTSSQPENYRVSTIPL